MLDSYDDHSGVANIFTTATLKNAPTSEHACFVRTFINLRTGQKHIGEEDAWANAQDGDNVLVTRAPDDPDAVGFVFKVMSVATKKAADIGHGTLAEASTWP